MGEGAGEGYVWCWGGVWTEGGVEIWGQRGVRRQCGRHVGNCSEVRVVICRAGGGLVLQWSTVSQWRRLF